MTSAIAIGPNSNQLHKFLWLCERRNKGDLVHGKIHDQIPNLTISCRRAHRDT